MPGFDSASLPFATKANTAFTSQPWCHQSASTMEGRKSQTTTVACALHFTLWNYILMGIFWFLNYWYFGPDNSLSRGGPVSCRVCGSVPGNHPLGARGTPLPNCENQKCVRLWLTSPEWGREGHTAWESLGYEEAKFTLSVGGMWPRLANQSSPHCPPALD